MIVDVDKFEDHEAGVQCKYGAENERFSEDSVQCNSMVANWPSSVPGPTKIAAPYVLLEFQ